MGRLQKIPESDEYVPTTSSIGIQQSTPSGPKTFKPKFVDQSLIPVEGMVFDTLNQACRFYKNYAEKSGFEVRKSTHKTVKMDGEIVVTLKYYVCNREGYLNKPKLDSTEAINGLSSKGSNDTCETNSLKEDGSKNKPKRLYRTRPSQRCGCDARFQLELTEEKKYVLYKFEEEHNHALVDPEYRKHLKSNRKLDYSKKVMLKNLADASIGPSVGFRVLTKIHGGHDNVGATEVECLNFKRDCNALIGDGDAQMLVDMLKKKKEYLPDFTFEYFTNGAEFRGAFWEDDQSKRNYHAFGDVVSFDATYRKNKYGMVFIPFIGVDNHTRTVTFGAALLSKEDVPSYKWLCSMFLKAYPREPQIIMTDQDPAVKIAIEHTFVKAKHRLCMWHITEKFSTMVGVSVCNAGFRADISKIIWTDKLEPTEFEEKWFQILDRYDLKSNKWLKRMFSLREQWVPAFFRDWAMSGLMRTSSRSESTNHMFGQLMKVTDTLVEFWGHFDTAMQSQRHIQSKKDYQSFYTTPQITPDVPFEKDAVLFYSRTIFIEVQKEIRASIKYCMSREFYDNGGIKKYTIVDSSVISTALDDEFDRENDPKHFDALIPKESQVTYNESQQQVSCSCKHYERFGLLCRHIFYVLRMSNVKHFPKKYICRRWMQDVVPRRYSDSAPDPRETGDKEEEVGSMLREIYYQVDYSVRKLLRDPERLAIFLDIQRGLAEKTEDHMGDQESNSKDFASALLGLKKPRKVDVFAPKGIVNKGGGTKRRRITSSREESINKTSKNKRLCAYCKKQVYHDIRNCPKKKTDEDANPAHCSDSSDGSEGSESSDGC